MRKLSAACIIQYANSETIDNDVLLGFNVKKGGWENCGGKNEGNETVDETARRELLEEVGWDSDLRAMHLVPAGYYEGDDDWFCAIFHAFLFKRTHPGSPPEPENHREWRWFDRAARQAIEAEMTPACRNLLRKHGLM